MNAPLGTAQKAQALAITFAARAAQYDREGRFPSDNFTDLHQAGLLTLAAPRAYGGTQAGITELAAVIATIAAADAPTALVLTMQYMQHRGMLRDSGWPVTLARLVTEDTLHRGALINALRVEPDLGSPARGGLPNTVARQSKQGWHLSGHKIYSTGAPALSWYVVWARTDEQKPRVGAFLVPAAAAGVRIVETWDHLGMRASGSHDIVLENVAIPLDHAIDLRPPAEWGGAREAPMQAEMALLLGSLYDAIARAARDWLLGFLHTRKPSSLGTSLAQLPRLQEAVGAIETQLFVNQRLLADFARHLEAGDVPAAAESGLLKHVVTGNAIEAVQSVVSLASNHGLARNHPVERHLRDVLCGRVHTPQDDSVRVAAGRRALGL